MFKWVFISFFLISTLWAHTDSTDKMLVSFKLTPEISKFLHEEEFDVTGVNHDQGIIHALLTQEEINKFEQKNVKMMTMLPQLLLRGPDPEYQNHEEIEEALKNYQQKYSDLTELVEIGKSLEGRSIWAIRISDNVKNKDYDEPVILFNSMHHAREIMTPEISLDIIDYLLSNYKSDKKVQNWVDGNEIWVIPMFNVDGNNIMWTKDSMWRKNARNGYGVDLNRNYPFGWNSCNGSSNSTSAQNYRGPNPASEPETQAMMDFVSKIKPVFNISYHSYSELVLYPYGCKPNVATNSEVVAIGQEMGKRLKYKAGTPWELLYNADGGDIDWMYQVEQVIPYVIEVNSTMEGFHPDYNRARNKTVERNRLGWQYLFERLEGSGIRGRVQSQENNIDIEVSQFGKKILNYKVNPDGTFHLILTAGEYNLVFRGLNMGQKSQNVKVENKLVRLESI